MTSQPAATQIGMLMKKIPRHQSIIEKSAPSSGPITEAAAHIDAM